MPVLGLRLLKISYGLWDMGESIHVHGYAIKVKYDFINVLQYSLGPKIFTKHKILFRNITE